MERKKTGSEIILNKWKFTTNAESIRQKKKEKRIDIEKETNEREEKKTRTESTVIDGVVDSISLNLLMLHIDDAHNKTRIMNFEITKCPIGNEDIVVTWIFIVLKRKKCERPLFGCVALLSNRIVWWIGWIWIHIVRLQGATALQNKNWIYWLASREKPSSSSTKKEEEKKNRRKYQSMKKTFSPVCYA